MCTVLLPPAVNPIAVHKYIISHYKANRIFTEYLPSKEQFLRESLIDIVNGIAGFQHINTGNI